MGTGQAYAGYGQVRLISPYEIHTLTDLRIEQNLNEHGQLLVRGIIPDNKQDTYIQLPVSHQTIAVQEVDDQGEPGRVLFQGLVQEVSISAIQGVYYLELSAVTYSMLMDLEPRSRSFSGEEGTYRDIVDTVLAAYDGADKLDNILNNQRPAGMVLQYKETDWAFIRRIASQFGAAVFPEVTAASPKLFLGIPEGRYWELALQPYVLHRDLAREEEIRKQTIHQEGEIDEQIYTVETEQLYKLGDKIQFLEKELTVVGFTGQFKAGRLVYEYQFTPSEKNLQKPLYNSPLIGSSLDGTVVEVKGSKIQVHLTIDGEREVRHWLAYETPYTAEGHGGGWYSMPESGDAVRVYFPSVREESAIVTSSFRKAPLPNRASDPATKVWATPFGKEMRFQRSDITLSARQEKIFLKIDDKSGLTFQSEHDLILKSHADILASVSSLRVNAGEGIYVHCQSSSMILDGETDIKAGSLQVEGLKKSPVYIEDLPPVPEVPFVDEVASEAGNTGKASGPVGILGMAQLGLQVAGMFPMVGAAATGARAGLGVAQISSIAMSVASSLPFVGGAIRAANLGRSLAVSYDPFQEQIDTMQRLGFDLAGATYAWRVYSAARGMKSEMTAEEFAKRLKIELDKADEEAVWRLEKAVEFYNSKRKGDEGEFASYYTAVISGLGVYHGAENIGNMDYWLNQNPSLGRKDEISRILMTAGTPEAQFGILFVFEPIYEQHTNELAGGYGMGAASPRPRPLPPGIKSPSRVKDLLQGTKMKVNKPNESKKPFFPEIDWEKTIDKLKKSKEQFKEKLDNVNFNTGQNGLAFEGVPSGVGKGNKSQNNPFDLSKIFSNYVKYVSSQGNSGGQGNKPKPVNPPAKENGKPNWGSKPEGMTQKDYVAHNGNSYSKNLRTEEYNRYNDRNKIKVGDNNNSYHILKELTNWMQEQGMVKITGTKRNTWRSKDGHFWQWDAEGGKLEKWDRNKKQHLGEFDPVNGKQTKPPKQGRQWDR